MPVPELNADGFLPPGVFDCSLDEICQRFGSFQGSEHRQRLFARFQELVFAMRRSEIFEAVLVDGSFVTEKAAPNDIDLIAVLRPDHSFERELSMAQYSLVSRPLLRRRFGFDVILARRGSELYHSYIEFFGQVRGAKHLRKGLLRLRL